MSLALFNASVTDDAVTFLTEREQAVRDTQDEAHWERAERIERSVSFDDVLEAMTEMSDDAKKQFMQCLARMTRLDATEMALFVANAKAHVIARRLKAGE